MARAKTNSMNAQERQWAAQSALETLTRATAIQGDKKLMADVKKLAAQQISTIQKVAGTTTPKKK